MEEVATSGLDDLFGMDPCPNTKAKHGADQSEALGTKNIHNSEFVFWCFYGTLLVTEE